MQFIDLRFVNIESQGSDFFAELDNQGASLQIPILQWQSSHRAKLA
jgi:hypothetical protein